MTRVMLYGLVFAFARALFAADGASPQAPEPVVEAASEAVSEAKAPSPGAIAAVMKTSHAALAAGRADAQAQQAQQAAIAQLDALIEAMKGAPSPSGSSKMPPPSSSPQGAANNDAAGNGEAAAEKVARDSIERHGTANAAAPAAAPRGRTNAAEFWGRLPPAIRERAFQRPAGQAPPVYREAVEEYFKRLLEESR